MTEWKVIDIGYADYMGVIEFEDPREEGEYIHFEVVATDKYLVFGGACNVGLLQSGYMEIDNQFSPDDYMQELREELEVYYRDGKEYVSMIVTNDRM